MYHHNHMRHLRYLNHHIHPFIYNSITTTYTCAICSQQTVARAIKFSCGNVPSQSHAPSAIPEPSHTPHSSTTASPPHTPANLCQLNSCLHNQSFLLAMYHHNHMRHLRYLILHIHRIHLQQHHHHIPASVSTNSCLRNQNYLLVMYHHNHMRHLRYLNLHIHRIHLQQHHHHIHLRNLCQLTVACAIKISSGNVPSQYSPLRYLNLTYTAFI